MKSGWTNLIVFCKGDCLKQSQGPEIKFTASFLSPFVSTRLFVSLPVSMSLPVSASLVWGGCSVSSWPNHLVFFTAEIRPFPLKSRPFRLADPVFSTMRIRFRGLSPASRLPISSVGKAAGPSEVHGGPTTG